MWPKYDRRLVLKISTMSCLSVGFFDIEAWLKASRLRLNLTETQMMCLGSPQQLAKVNVSEVLVASARRHTAAICADSVSWLSTTTPRRVTSASSSTASWRYLRRCRPCVAVATISYGSSDRLSDRCHLTPSRRWSRRLFYVTLSTATYSSTASLTVWWAGWSLFRMRLHVWCLLFDVMTTKRRWLPVRRRVDFKIATLVYLSLPGMAPAYLAADC